MKRETKSFTMDEGSEGMLIRIGGHRKETYSETINRLIREAHAKEMPGLHSMVPEPIERDSADYPWIRQVRLTYESYQKVAREASRLGIAPTAWIRGLIEKA